MNDRGELSGIQPVKFRNKKLQANFQDLFISLGKAAFFGFFGNLPVAGATLTDALKALGLQDEPEYIAWLLIYRSLDRAMFALVESNADLLEKKLDDRALKELCDRQLNLSLQDLELTLTSEFFLRPKNLPILEPIKTPLAQLLQGFGLKEAEARSMAGRLPSYFVFALHKEWGTNSKDYASIQEVLKTPFAEASDREREWQRYGGWLQQQVDEPMFEEPFSLKQVYVPLRAYYDRKPEKQQEWEFEYRQAPDKKDERVVVDLHEEINAWLNKCDRDDAIRIISGGLGSGKSSFVKMLAAELAETAAIPVLFVPFHHFNPSDDLVDAIGKFVRDDPILSHNPLDKQNRESRLLIIFDALDELAMSGKIAAEIARNFVREVQKKVERFNGSETRLQVLISVRELVIQANASDLRKPSQILHVLPYFIPEGEWRDYHDSEKLLKRDDRQQWWANYGKASGRGYLTMPPELDRDNLVEITQQPLLNYLIALSFVRGMQFSDDTNLNSIYKDLLSAVYQRDWERSRNPALEGVNEDDFICILEEIGLASWHSGGGRTTTVKEIEAHCDRSGQKRLLEQFQEGAKAGVTRLLTAFYFRESGYSTEGEKSFEFTHKSFGEYLTAKRIVREVRRIHTQLERRRREPDDGWDEREALTCWAILCGPSTMEDSLFDFIVNEIQLLDISEVRKWQQDLCHLTGFMLRHGMPMQRLDPRPDYQEENRQARNAEEALLAVINACARATKVTSQIKWPDEAWAVFGDWMARLQGQRRGLILYKVLAFRCLSFLDLSKSILSYRDLLAANLEGANLVDAHLEGAFLRYANLKSANLTDAMLVFANLENAHLEGANLAGAELKDANLAGADLEGANLAGADLAGANLQLANLAGANLARANLDIAMLQGADLADANLEDANLEDANLEGANLKGANLKGANLKGANLKEDMTPVVKKMLLRRC